MLTVKNSSLKTENNITTLRINFHVPGSGAYSKDINFPVLRGAGAVFLKEVTYKSS